jgi:hypothetical protein
MSFQRLSGEAEWWVEWASTLSFVQSMSGISVEKV